VAAGDAGGVDRGRNRPLGLIESFEIDCGVHLGESTFHGGDTKIVNGPLDLG
jgi:hypothetical protein